MAMQKRQIVQGNRAAGELITAFGVPILAPVNVYLQLTREFNEGRLRAVISSGQAVVLHRLAIMSKDGDWILREDEEALQHVLGALERHGARYRFGAPLDARWMRGGWSSHFEFREAGLRVRADFVTRPPRLAPDEVERMWREVEGCDPPFVRARLLAELKKTNREKDYAVIGELARLMQDELDQLLYSRSARDLVDLAKERPDLLKVAAERRPALAAVPQGPGRLEEALDAERRNLMHENEKRLLEFAQAAERWRAAWPEVESAAAGSSLTGAHRILVRRAVGILPYTSEGKGSGMP